MLNLLVLVQILHTNVAAILFDFRWQCLRNAAYVSFESIN